MCLTWLPWLKNKEACGTLPLSMVAKFWNQRFLVLTCLFFGHLVEKKLSPSSLNSMQELGGILPLIDSGKDDLESFRAWSEKIKRTMSQTNPLLHVVLGEIVSSKQPIEEENIRQASQSIMEEKQRAIRVPIASFEKKEALQGE